jgi:hypothetical protein
MDVGRRRVQPSLMRSGVPVASARASLVSQSASGSSSSQWRSVTAMASRTRSVIGVGRRAAVGSFGHGGFHSGVFGRRPGKAWLYSRDPPVGLVSPVLGRRRILVDGLSWAGLPKPAWPRGPASRFGRSSFEFLVQLARAGAAVRDPHRRRIVAAVVMALGGFTVTAFGIAPLMPDAASLPVRSWSSRADPRASSASSTRWPRSPWTCAAAPSAAAPTAPRPAAAPGRGRRRRCGLHPPGPAGSPPGARPRRQAGAGHADADGSLQQLVARYPAERSPSAQTHFTRLTLDKVGALAVRVETAPLCEPASGWAAAASAAACSRPPTKPACPTPWPCSWPRSSPPTSTSTASCARATPSRVVYESLSADGETVPWNEGAGRVLAAEFVNAGTDPPGGLVRRRPGRGGLFRARRPEPAPRLPGQPAGVLARDLGLRDALPSAAEELARAPGHRLWRAHRHAGARASATAWCSSPAARTAMATWSRCSTATIAAPVRPPEPHRRAQGPARRTGRAIGAVGATGWATGPHLHFEFRVNGQHQDPLVIAKASEAWRSTGRPQPLQPRCQACRPSCRWPPASAARAPASNRPPRRRGMRCIGLMSGTSLDGVDGVLAELPTTNSRPAGGCCAHVHSTCHRPCRRTAGAESVRPRRVAPRRAGRQRPDAVYADVVGACWLNRLPGRRRGRASAPTARPCATSRLAFDGSGYTLQLANGALLAERTGITTVCDFRVPMWPPAGQGPAGAGLPRRLLRPADADAAVLNVGGIANLTLLPPTAAVGGFDTGPGNVLMDLWSRRQRAGLRCWTAPGGVGQRAGRLLTATAGRPVLRPRAAQEHRPRPVQCRLARRDRAAGRPAAQACGRDGHAGGADGPQSVRACKAPGPRCAFASVAAAPSTST